MRKLFAVLLASGLFFVAAPAFAANGTISGTVTHAADATPVVGIYLSATNTSTGASTYVYGTEVDGTYSFSLAPGEYDVSPYSYTSEEPFIYFLEQTQTVTLSSGETESGTDFSLTRRGRFTGTVSDSDGDPIQGASLYVTNDNSSGYGTTVSNGTYTATPINDDGTRSAVGNFTFSVSRAGYFSKTVSDVALSADESSVTKNITLTAASRVSGKIRKSNGSALSNATVTLTKSNGTVYSALTNASGNYTVSIYDLYPYDSSAIGTYTLSVTKSGYVTKTGSVSITSNESNKTGNNFSLATSGKITGTVKKSNGNGLAGATITAEDGFGHTYTATTASNGTYSLPSLKPSKHYSITATKTFYVGQKMYNVTVSAGHTTTKRNFTLPSAKKFSGTIKDASGGGLLDGAVVSLYKQNRARSEFSDLSFTSKSDGKFSFQNVSAGTYRLKIVKTGYTTYVQDSLEINGDLTGQTYKLSAGGSIFGKVYSGSKAVSGTDIWVYALQNGREVDFSIVSSDEKGYFRVSGLKQGTYRLRVNTTKYVTRFVDVRVTQGQQTKNNIKLAAAGSTSGYITDRVTGTPVSAYVKVVGTDIGAWSNSNGYYVIDGLAPGTRRLTVISVYYDLPTQKAVAITANRIKTGVNFSLTPRQ
jgi:hypothetical protein